MGKKVVFVVLDQFADWEGAYLSSILMNEELSTGNQVFWASTDREPKRSIGQMTILPDLTLEEIPEDTDALILIGGNSWRTQSAGEVTSLVRKFKDLGKVIGFICDATYYAAKEGFLNDVTHTGNNPDEMKENAGYTNPSAFVRQNAVLDGKIITANGNSPVEFAGQVLRALDFGSEEDIQMITDFHMIGYWNALRKYGYLKEE